MQQRKFYLSITLSSLLILLVCASASATVTQKSVSHNSKKLTAHHTYRGHHYRKSRYRRSSWKHRGQQKIDSDRTTQIQQALIDQKYLEGEPSGVWDQRTQEAMTRYQSDHGWQTKMLPDSRALISLGLGPKPDNLLNPDTAMGSSFAPATGNTQLVEQH